MTGNQDSDLNNNLNDSEQEIEWRGELQKNAFDIDLRGRFQMDQTAKEKINLDSKELSKVNSEVPTKMMSTGEFQFGDGDQNIQGDVKEKTSTQGINAFLNGTNTINQTPVPLSPLSRSGSQGFQLKDNVAHLTKINSYRE